jgi:hypothetical protein
VYFGWGARIIRGLTPNSLRKRFKNKISYGDYEKSPGSDSVLLNMAIPNPNPKNWPFYVSDVNKHCLNFLAICGFDNLIIEKAASEIKRSA